MSVPSAMFYFFPLDLNSRNCLIEGFQKAPPAVSVAAGNTCNVRHGTSVTSASQLCSLISEGTSRTLRLLDRTDAGAVPGWPMALFGMLNMLYVIFLGWRPRIAKSQLRESFNVLVPFLDSAWWLIGFARWSRNTSVGGVQNTSNWTLNLATAFLQLQTSTTRFGFIVSLTTLLLAGLAAAFTIPASWFQTLGWSSSVGYITSLPGAYNGGCTFSHGLHAVFSPLQAIAVSRWRFVEGWYMIFATFLVLVIAPGVEQEIDEDEESGEAGFTIQLQGAGEGRKTVLPFKLFFGDLRPAAFGVLLFRGVKLTLSIYRATRRGNTVLVTPDIIFVFPSEKYNGFDQQIALSVLKHVFGA